ncbi:hypothetical protein Tco_1362800 [Tanacetum coccineum]
MLRTYRLKESLSSKHAKKVRAELAIDDPAAVVTVKPATKQTVKNIANEVSAKPLMLVSKNHNVFFYQDSRNDNCLLTFSLALPRL